MFKTTVIDDVVPEDHLDDLVAHVMRGPWQFIEDMAYNGEHHYGLSQQFLKYGTGVVSSLFETVAVPIINAGMARIGLQIKGCDNCRAFLQLPLAEKFRGENNGVHIDNFHNHIAAVFYMFDSDGDTIIYENTKHNTILNAKDVKLVEHARVTPKENRIVFFDGARYHCSSQPKDNLRLIINYNLIV